MLRTIAPAISRISQLESVLYDKEIEDILREPLWNALALVKNSLKTKFEPELKTFLRLVLLYTCIFSDKRATAGQQLLNLKYVNSKYMSSASESILDALPSTRKLHALILLSTLPSYIFTRLQDKMIRSAWADETAPIFRIWYDREHRRLRRQWRWRTGSWKRVIYELTNKAERAWLVIEFINFAVFLKAGKYPSMVERLLGLRLTYAVRTKDRNISFEYLNRQLVWEALTEFLLFIMPLINLRRLLSSLSPLQLLRTIHILPPATITHADETYSKGPLHHLPLKLCAICFSRSSASLPPASGQIPITGGAGSAFLSDPLDPTSSIVTLSSFSGVAASASGRVGGIEGGDNFATLSDGEDWDVRIPYMVNCCKARYCYYCIVEEMVKVEESGVSDGRWECLRCGKRVEKVVRWDGLSIAQTERPDGRATIKRNGREVHQDPVLEKEET